MCVCARDVGGWMYLQACALQLAPQSYAHKQKYTHAACTLAHPNMHARKHEEIHTHTHPCAGSLVPKRAWMRPSSTGEARGRGALLAAVEVRSCN